MYSFDFSLASARGYLKETTACGTSTEAEKPTYVSARSNIRLFK